MSVYYNLTITLISMLVALLIGSIETLSIIGDKLNLQGPFWDFIGNLSDNFGTIGYLIIGIFIISWIISTIVYKLKRYDEIEVVSIETREQETGSRASGK